jgi:hypothetical protein
VGVCIKGENFSKLDMKAAFCKQICKKEMSKNEAKNKKVQHPDNYGKILPKLCTDF